MAVAPCTMFESCMRIPNLPYATLDRVYAILSSCTHGRRRSYVQSAYSASAETMESRES